MLLRATRFVTILESARRGIPGGGMVTAAQTVTRFLRRLGEDAEPPPIAPARRPPFFTSPALRRRFGELDSDSLPQLDMFGE